MNTKIKIIYKLSDGRYISVKEQKDHITKYSFGEDECMISKDGVFLTSFDYSDEFRVGEKYREPIKYEGWVNADLYSGNGVVFSEMFKSKELADSWAKHNRIACIYVSGQEE